MLNGAFGLVPEKLNGFVSSADIPALTFKNQESAGFFLNWMLASYKTLALERTGTSTTLKRISKEGFLSSAIWLPSVKEQQKIAATFSSLDDLITAQNAKLAALQAHKRGLMQALFPAEGETVPKLRFSEFQDAGEWEEKKFGQLGNLVSGLTYSPKDVRENGLLVLRSSNVQNGKIALDDCVYVTPTVKGANLSKPNDILICVRNGSKALIGKNALIPDGMPLCTHGAFMTVFRSPNPAFVFQLLQSDSYNKQVSEDLGATINSINGNQLLKYIFYVPELEEQKKIAECLSALDDSITAQSQKIEALKLHKKGLMQRLFPALLEAAV
ncbi:restriction endonuclease subunit S [Hymenobacter sp. J193]|uniref:restriction endonuclease subunit S n=1 Tax=Hymenobacter sp. J193 TaxID=2898429 RepID=UPI002151FC33|nr:restriction endonuclease subunit S [Hymenobacter sp. J193]MCR5890846.1 restriction endonuclease subunit S [Hymenobacter sp. J193]